MGISFLRRLRRKGTRILSRASSISLVRRGFLTSWLFQNRRRLRAKSVSASRLRVLYVDTLSEPHAQANVAGMQKAYEKVGIVEPFDYRRLASSWGPKLMNEILYQTAVLFQPDLIHLGKSESVQGKTIHRIRESVDTCVIHFYGDFRCEPQPWVVDIGQHADLTLLYHKDKDVIQKHRDMGIQHIGFWWVGTDPEVFFPREISKKYDVVFMANNTSDYGEATGQGYVGRVQLIDAIAGKGLHLHLFGRGWDYLSDRPTVRFHPFVNDCEFAEACSAAKITLGFNTNRVYMYTSWRRPLNSMACAAFHLTRYFPGLEEVFENGRHLVWFRSIPEAIELIEYYLVHDEERERIAGVGRQEVLANHTWDHRIADMLGYQHEYAGMQEVWGDSGIQALYGPRRDRRRGRGHSLRVDRAGAENGRVRKAVRRVLRR